MKYNTAVIIGFFAVLIYLFYIGVFGILHGLRGIIIWSFVFLVLVILAKIISS